MTVMRSAYYGTGEYGGSDYGIALADHAIGAPHAEVQSGGAYATAMTLFLADRSGRKLERLPLEIPVQGTVSYNEDTSPARRLALEVNHPHRLDPFRDYLIPELTMRDAAGNVTTRPLGHYLVTPPSTTLTASRFSGDLQAHDITWLLMQDTFRDSVTIPAGTDTGEAARTIATAVLDTAQVNLPDTGTMLATPMQIDAGTSRMEAITDLYALANYYKPWMTGSGVLTTTPALDLETAAASRVYRVPGDDVTIVPPVSESPEWTRLRNRVTVRNIAPEREPIVATAEVTNPDSPVHPENIGGDPTRPLWLAQTVDDPQVDTPEAALARAQRLLAEGASWYRKLSIRTLVDLDADAHDVIELDVAHAGARYDGRWMRRAWTVELQGVTALTVSEVTRIERWR